MQEINRRRDRRRDGKNTLLVSSPENQVFSVELRKLDANDHVPYGPERGRGDRRKIPGAIGDEVADKKVLAKTQIKNRSISEVIAESHPRKNPRIEPKFSSIAVANGIKDEHLNIISGGNDGFPPPRGISVSFDSSKVMLP